MLPKITRRPDGITIENLSVNEYELIRSSLKARFTVMELMQKDGAKFEEGLIHRLKYLYEDLYTSGVICECTDTFICAMHGGPEITN